MTFPCPKASSKSQKKRGAGNIPGSFGPGAPSALRPRSRLAGYVVELRNCSGATGAAFARVYYARAAEQQKARQFCRRRPAAGGLGGLGVLRGRWPGEGGPGAPPNFRCPHGHRLIGLNITWYICLKSGGIAPCPSNTALKIAFVFTKMMRSWICLFQKQTVLGAASVTTKRHPQKIRLT